MTRYRLYTRVEPEHECCGPKGTLPDCPIGNDAVVQCLECRRWWRTVQNSDYPYWRRCSDYRAAKLIERWQYDVEIKATNLPEDVGQVGDDHAEVGGNVPPDEVDHAD